MKIALLGYGRMGKEIEKIAIERGHSVVHKLDEKTSTGEIGEADVAINFSVPNAAFSNIKTAFSKSIPVVCGTTGWLENLEETKQLCLDKNTAFLYSSNFSIGVNLFFRLNRDMAKLMKKQKEYKPNVTEIHHVHKLDAPSGTAITLAEGIMESSDYTNWTQDENKESDLFIHSEREGEVPGTHVVSYLSEVDTLSIKHEAHSRKGFALGAVVAAEWIKNKKGIFTMEDVLDLN